MRDMAYLICLIKLYQITMRRKFRFFVSDHLKVIGIRPLAPVQNNVSPKLMQRKTLNFVINLPDVENITK